MKTILYTVLLHVWLVKIDQIIKGNKKLKTIRNSVTQGLMLVHTRCISCVTSTIHITNHIFDCFYGTFMTLNFSFQFQETEYTIQKIKNARK